MGAGPGRIAMPHQGGEFGPVADDDAAGCGRAIRQFGSCQSPMCIGSRDLLSNDQGNAEGRCGKQHGPVPASAGWHRRRSVAGDPTQSRLTGRFRSDDCDPQVRQRIDREPLGRLSSRGLPRRLAWGPVLVGGSPAVSSADLLDASEGSAACRRPGGGQRGRRRLAARGLIGLLGEVGSRIGGGLGHDIDGLAALRFGAPCPRSHQRSRPGGGGIGDLADPPAVFSATSATRAAVAVANGPGHSSATGSFSSSSRGLGAPTTHAGHASRRLQMHSRASDPTVSTPTASQTTQAHPANLRGGHHPRRWPPCSRPVRRAARRPADYGT